MKPKFIVLEGIDGAGKTTHARLLSNYLSSKNVPHVLTMEPYDVGVCDSIKKILISHSKSFDFYTTDDTLSEETEILLWFANRYQHIRRVIKPALDSSKWVICDRFTPSTYSYQGDYDIDYSHGLLNKISVLENNFQAGIYPDFVFLLDVDVEVSIERLRKRDPFIENDKSYLNELQKNLNRIRKRYLSMSNTIRAECFCEIIDANKSSEIVINSIIKVLEQFIR